MVTAMATALVAGWIMTYSFGEFGRHRDEEHYRSELDFARSAFAVSVETADDLAKSMAASPNLINMGLQGSTDRRVINSTLDRYAGVIRGSICYVLDSSGTTLASSNRDTPESFVGYSYAVRPYFQEAMKGLQGRYVAVGLTSKVPGYYVSSPLRDVSGSFVGAAVVKLNLDNTFMAPMTGNLGFLVDSNGIILASTHPGFFLKTLRPLSPAVQQRLAQTQQFPALSDFPVLPAGHVSGALLTFHGEVLQSFEENTSVEGLSFVLLGSMNSWKMMRLVSILITLLVTVLLLVFFVVQQRNSESQVRIATSEKLYRTLVEGTPNWIRMDVVSPSTPMDLRPWAGLRQRLREGDFPRSGRERQVPCWKTQSAGSSAASGFLLKPTISGRTVLQ